MFHFQVNKLKLVYTGCRASSKENLIATSKIS